MNATELADLLRRVRASLKCGDGTALGLIVALADEVERLVAANAALRGVLEQWSHATVAILLARSDELRAQAAAADDDRAALDAVRQAQRALADAGKEMGPILAHNALVALRAAFGDAP